MFILCGKTGCGKTTICNRLKAIGYTIPSSYTTRPPRAGENTGHFFIGNSAVKPVEEKIALAEIFGHEYFYTVDQVENADILVLNPQGIIDITKKFPKMDFVIIMLDADARIRFKRSTNRTYDKERAKQEFNEREDKERQDFKTIFKWYLTREGMPSNIRSITVLENNHEGTKQIDNITESINSIITQGYGWSTA